jgi:SynChlorMet cassette radical SAM/SPASM protein ScmF
VKLTGGEPLIHPEFDGILTYLAGTDLRLTIETNGMELSRRRAELIKACKNPFVSISVDGADAETHDWVRGVEGSFQAALLGAKNLVDVGIRPQFIMALMRRNADQIEDLVKLAERHGAGSVKFNLVTPTERGKQMHEAGETLSIEELIAIGTRVADQLQESTSLRLIYSHPDAFRPLGAFVGKRRGGGRCGIFNILGVLGNGKYALCGIGETVPELIFGDARVDSLESVWKESSVLQEIRKGLPSKLKGVCAECLMNNLCLGSCIALNYYRARDLFAPYWYCDQAYSAGLFPTTRLRKTE